MYWRWEEDLQSHKKTFWWFYCKVNDKISSCCRLNSVFYENGNLIADLYEKESEAIDYGSCHLNQELPSTSVEYPTLLRLQRIINDSGCIEHQLSKLKYFLSQLPTKVKIIYTSKMIKMAHRIKFYNGSNSFVIKWS